MIKRAVFSLLLISLFFTGLKAQDGCRVDQQQLSTAGGGSIGAAAMDFQAQIFVPGFTCILHTVDVWLSTQNAGSVVTVEIQTLVGGLPSGIVVGSVTAGPLGLI